MKPVLDIVNSEGQAQSVDPELILAIINAESGFDVQARSNVGAVGLMQVMPETAKEQGLKPGEDLESPPVNIYHGTRYLRRMLTAYGNVPEAISAYLGGPGNEPKGNGVKYPQYVGRVYSLYIALKILKDMKSVLPIVLLGVSASYIIEWISKK